MKIILIRHGQTNFNNNNQIQGHSFTSRLNENGKNQVEKLSKIINKRYKNIDIIISSDLTRTIQTTKIIYDNIIKNKKKDINKNIKTPKIIFDKNLREINRGKFNFKKIEKNHQWSKFENLWEMGIDFENKNDLKFETYKQLKNRVSNIIKKIKIISKNKNINNIILVSHGEFNKFFISQINKKTIEEYLTKYRKEIKQPNCCINEFEYNLNYNDSNNNNNDEFNNFEIKIIGENIL